MQRSANRSINIHDKREKNPSGKPEGAQPPQGFSTRIFLEFGVNILCSAEQSSADSHYSSFFGRHNHSIFTPRGDIEYQKNTEKYPSLLLVLWRQCGIMNIMLSSAQQNTEYSLQTREKSLFSSLIFLSFVVNIYGSASQISAYCSNFAKLKPRVYHSDFSLVFHEYL